MGWVFLRKQHKPRSYHTAFELCGNCTADQHLRFSSMDSTVSLLLNPNSKASSHLFGCAGQFVSDLVENRFYSHHGSFIPEELSDQGLHCHSVITCEKRP